ncbi:hypothetical protein P3L10_031882 [Capsicum annuum]
MARKLQSHNLAVNLVGFLLVVVLLAVHTSNIEVMAVRDLPDEFNVFAQMLPPNLNRLGGCGSRCESNDDCNGFMCNTCAYRPLKGRMGCTS